MKRNLKSIESKIRETWEAAAMTKKILFTALFPVLFIAGLCAKETPADSPRTLHLLYTSSSVGYIDPCG